MKRIDFYNINGQVVLRNNIVSENAIKLSENLPTGIYFAAAIDRKGNTIQVLKFSKH